MDIFFIPFQVALTSAEAAAATMAKLERILRESKKFEAAFINAIFRIVIEVCLLLLSFAVFFSFSFSFSSLPFSFASHSRLHPPLPLLHVFPLTLLIL